VIVNAALARTFFPGEDAVGRRIHPGVARDGESVVREIVGVVGDIRHRGLDAEATPEFYVPYAQLSISDMTVVARMEGGSDALAADARALVAEIDPDVPVFRVQTLQAAILHSIQQPRFNALLLGLFAGVALVLTGVGLYGVLGYVVAVRTREIVIRMALGARRSDILGMIVRRGLRLSLAGVVIGLAAALAVTRLFRSLLYEVAPSDPVALLGAALTLSAVALAASAVPAWRASRIDPMKALRAE
jgi:putative ABC transport system permease protein